jgi:hypothetical protein
VKHNRDGARHRLVLATDLDGTLVGDGPSLARLSRWIRDRRDAVKVVYLTTRPQRSASSNARVWCYRTYSSATWAPRYGTHRRTTPIQPGKQESATDGTPASYEHTSGQCSHTLHSVRCLRTCDWCTTPIRRSQRLAPQSPALYKAQVFSAPWSQVQTA